MQFDKDIKSIHSKLFADVRRFLLSYEDIEETKKEKITTYADKNAGICHIRTTKTGVDVGFLKGAFINDSLGLLHGKTKRMRVLSLEKMDEEALKYYIEESLRLNG